MLERKAPIPRWSRGPGLFCEESCGLWPAKPASNLRLFPVAQSPLRGPDSTAIDALIATMGITDFLMCFSTARPIGLVARLEQTPQFNLLLLYGFVK